MTWSESVPGIGEVERALNAYPECLRPRIGFVADQISAKRCDHSDEFINGGRLIWHGLVFDDRVDRFQFANFDSSNR